MFLHGQICVWQMDGRKNMFMIYKVLMQSTISMKESFMDLIFNILVIGENLTY